MPLVAELPMEGESPRDLELQQKRLGQGLNLVRVFETENPTIIMVAKSLLEDAGIEYFSSGEQLPFGFNPLSGSLVIGVRHEEAEEARELLKNLSC